MHDFAYSAPKTIADAVKALAADGEAKLIAGGQTLIPTLKQRLAQPSQVIDLGKIPELKGIRRESDMLVIGAMTRHGEVAASDVVKQAIPALAALAEGIGDAQVRNAGTLGGSVANNDPAADYPAAVLALNATVETSKRKIPADQFFKGMFETALAADEILKAIHFPVPQKAAYVKFPNPASRYAVVGVFVAKHASGVRVAVTGAGPGVFRASPMEAALGKEFSAKALEGITIDADNLNADVHASAQYRAHLVTVMAKRAVTACG